MSRPTRRGRPRQAETDERLLSAAAELLREKGPAGVTVEGVSARSGVARTTIYRRYDTRRQLIAAVIDPIVDRPLPPVDLPVEDKVRWVLDQVAGFLEDGLGRGAVAAIVADTDPEFTLALRAALDRGLEPLRRQIQTDVDSVGVAADTDPDAVINLLFGAYLGEVLRHGAPRARWAESTIALVAGARVGPRS